MYILDYKTIICLFHTANLFFYSEVTKPFKKFAGKVFALKSKYNRKQTTFFSNHFSTFTIFVFRWSGRNITLSSTYSLPINLLARHSEQVSFTICFNLVRYNHISRTTNQHAVKQNSGDKDTNPKCRENFRTYN